MKPFGPNWSGVNNQVLVTTSVQCQDSGSMHMARLIDCQVIVRQVLGKVSAELSIYSRKNMQVLFLKEGTTN